MEEYRYFCYYYFCHNYKYNDCVYNDYFYNYHFCNDLAISKRFLQKQWAIQNLQNKNIQI